MASTFSFLSGSLALDRLPFHTKVAGIIKNAHDWMNYLTDFKTGLVNPLKYKID